MNPLLRIDGYLLAHAQGERWEAEWCAAHRLEGRKRWQFGSGSLLPVKHDGNENNSYFERLEAYDIGSGGSDLDMAYWHLQQFSSATNDASLDLLVSATLNQARLERLMGVLSALGHRPRRVLPHALLAAWQEARRRSAGAGGTYQLIELGRSHCSISTVRVDANEVVLSSPHAREYEFGFQQIFSQWMEQAAQEFAARQRFDIHRNLVANRERLFLQMRRASYDEDAQSESLELDSHVIALDLESFAINWPADMLEADADHCWLVRPLTQELALYPPGVSYQGKVSCLCPEGSVDAVRQALESVPEGDGPELITELKLGS